MTDAEYLRGLAMLTTALGFGMSKAQEALYFSRLRGLPDGAFCRGVSRLVDGEQLAEFARFRRLPTLHELRAACQESPAPRGRPHVGGVPLRDLLEAAAGAGDGQIDPDEAGELVSRVADRLEGGRPKLLPGPGNTGHRALARVLPALPASSLSPEQWEDRRRQLVEQADDLLGEGDERP